MASSTPAGTTDPYADPDRPGVVRIPIVTDKHPGMVALIDAADLPFVQGNRWNWSPGSRVGAGSVVLGVSGTPKPSLPRVLLGITDPQQLVSHLNGDRLDCRRANLVIRTRSEARRAAKKVMVKGGKVSSSRFKGVQRSDNGRKWYAAIVVAGKYRNLGRFRSEIDAALAYDAALRELMGEHVVGLNFVDAAEADRLRALEPVVDENPTWPPPGMVDRDEASRMFGVSLRTWTVWEQRGRITCGQYHPVPNDKPGRCKLYPRDELERARIEIEKLGKPYPDPELPGVWRVPLKSYLAHREVLIDEADLPVVEGRNWNWSEKSDGAVEGNVILATTAGWVGLHRLVARVTDPKTRVTFANGNPLDCRRANLTVVTLAQNVRANRKMGTVSGRKYTSDYKGVSWDAPRGKWLVQITSGRVYSHIGRFDSETDAAAAYDAAARVLFGDHAHLNFPDQPSTEQAMSDARAALDSAASQRRAARRRQRSLELALRAAGLDVAVPAADSGVVIPCETARLLFDVPNSVWERWNRFGWLPVATRGDDGDTYSLADVERRLLKCGLVVLPYPDPARPGVYRIPLAGETAQGREALIDADALPLVQTRRWRFAPSDYGRGGEVQTMNPSENVRLHYVVMGLGSDAQCHIGNRNDDPLDCRRENLVVRSLTDTRANARKQATFCGRPCTSRFKGVCWDERRGRWIARIKKDRVTRQIGSFRDEIAAAQAYDEAAREVFGEHARPNFPDGVDARLELDARAAAA
ncbi:MAG: AP2 domain-containing protein [Phycisphaerae bacterium]|nr:AP2 domain-containing protein [Tepidisphaeraceae bacterium]